MIETNHANQPPRTAPGSQANGIDGHTVDPRLPWPRCYPHNDTCPYETRRQCAHQQACATAENCLSRASLSLKYYQQLGIDMLNVHNP